MLSCARRCAAGWTLCGAGGPWVVAGRGLAGQALERNAAFAKLNDTDVDTFKDIVGPDAVLTDPHDVEPYNTDWMLKYHGHGRCVVRPRTTAQVSAILRHCWERRLALVPQGGNTGLVGGATPVFDEIVLSTQRMTDITSFDPVTGVLTAQAGAVLANCDAAARRHGHCMPLDLGAAGSCAIGGNVSTNAGGIRLLRYGGLHGNVLGVEAVLADGSVLDTLSTLRKDNTGYDLKQMFIGSEGTLGVVTAVSVLCPASPAATSVVYLAVPSFSVALQVLTEARKRLGELLSAFEFVDRESLDVVLKHLPNTRDPLPESDASIFLVVEVAGASEEHNAAMLEEFLEATMGAGTVVDGVVAQDLGQASEIWALREGVTEALRHRGAIYKYDLSFRTDEMYEIVEATRARMRTLFPGQVCSEGQTDLPIQVVGYGHLGDGNIHLNISVPQYSPQVEAGIEPWVYEYTASKRGSISAEHGVGRMKAPCLHYSKSPEAIATMKLIKQALDPRGILNPYKVIV